MKCRYHIYLYQGRANAGGPYSQPWTTSGSVIEWSGGIGKGVSRQDTHAGALEVDWTKRLTGFDFIIYDVPTGNEPGSNLDKFPALYMPTRLRVVITVVSPGGTYVRPGPPQWLSERGQAWLRSGCRCPQDPRRRDSPLRRLRRVRLARQYQQAG